MKVNLREILLLVLALVPVAQLYYLWSSIPDTIPVHYGIDGKADRFGGKETLLWLVPIVMLLFYGILAIAPLIDPKKRITYSQGGYYTIRLASMIFLCIIFVSYLLSLTGDWDFSRSVPLVIMGFIVVLGNYLPIIKPNYFIGVRTPWTLESEEVWTKTHRFSGRLWVAGGLFGFALQILWPTLPSLTSVGIIMVLAISSIAYSYNVYRAK
jgi:uncharacterized membrane protein